MLLSVEQSLTEQYRSELASLRMALGTDSGMRWSGSIQAEGSNAVACQRLPSGHDVCLVLNGDQLRPMALQAVSDAFSSFFDSFVVASSPAHESHGTISIALAPPLSGWVVTIEAPPSPTASWAWLAIILAPIAAAVLAVAGLVYWRQSQHATQTQRRIEMLAQVSHELRTPLANLKLYGSLIGQRAGPDPDIARYCGVIEAETDRLAALVDNALVCAKDGKTAPSKPELANPNDIAGTLVERFSPLFEGSGSVRLDLAAPNAIRFDRAAFERILINLLDNARKYAPGAEVLVRTKRDGDALVLIVEDKGPGLPGNLRQQLFTAFADGPESRGFGLGLAACHALAKTAGGEIRHYDAEPGAGFAARLPIQKPTPETQSADAGPSAEAATCAS